MNTPKKPVAALLDKKAGVSSSRPHKVQPKPWKKPLRGYEDEYDYQRKLQAALEAIGWKTQSHRDMFSNYIPDLSFAGGGVDGWIEVKYLPGEPSCLNDIKHYTRGQELWLRDAGAKGSGHCYLLIGTSISHTLIRWDRLKDNRLTPFKVAKIKAILTAPSMDVLVNGMRSAIKVLTKG